MVRSYGAITHVMLGSIKDRKEILSSCFHQNDKGNREALFSRRDEIISKFVNEEKEEICFFLHTSLYTIVTSYRPFGPGAGVA
jgi:hypothetical protein